MSANEKYELLLNELDELEAAAKANERQDYLDLLPGIRAIVARRKAAKKGDA